MTMSTSIKLLRDRNDTQYQKFLKILNSCLEVESDKTKTITLDCGKYIGEVVLLDDSVIHLLMARKEE